MGAKYFSIHTFHSNLNTNVPEGDEKSTVIVKTCQGHNRNILSIAKDPYQPIEYLNSLPMFLYGE